jgi:hypothetical protein
LIAGHYQSHFFATGIWETSQRGNDNAVATRSPGSMD